MMNDLFEQLGYQRIESLNEDLIVFERGDVYSNVKVRTRITINKSDCSFIKCHITNENIVVASVTYAENKILEHVLGYLIIM